MGNPTTTAPGILRIRQEAKRLRAYIDSTPAPTLDLPPDFAEHVAVAAEAVQYAIRQIISCSDTNELGMHALVAMKAAALNSLLVTVADDLVRDAVDQGTYQEFLENIRCGCLDCLEAEEELPF